ncbi:MAG: alpha/beta hydrolase [Glaciihabitans sp.]|nr:alpha/beta hydrolase [Glaciihabitans sp.]
MPGIYDSGPAHWQTLWQLADPSMVRIEPSSFDVPEVSDWLAAIDRAVDVAGPDCVLVAHSLGVLAAAEWLARMQPGRCAAAVLVAPADPRGENFPAAGADFSNVEPHRLPVPSLVLSSSNDRYCSLDRVSTFAVGWEAEQLILGALGHINADSGLGTWQQGRVLVNDFAEMVASSVIGTGSLRLTQTKVPVS